MNLRKHVFFYVLMIFSLSFATLVYAEKTDYRSHPEISTRMKGIKTIGIVPLDVKVYELSAGGVSELRDDWSAQAKENSMKVLIDSLKGKAAGIKTLTLDKAELQEEMDDVQALYRAVATCINWHTYGMHTFPEKEKNFDYSVGSIETILKAYGIDALVFVYGRDEISSGGRQALTAASIVVGIVTGVAAIPRAGITFMNVALVDTSGSVLWYNQHWSGAVYDLRKPESASSFVQKVLSDFPEVGK